MHDFRTYVKFALQGHQQSLSLETNLNDNVELRCPHDNVDGRNSCDESVICDVDDFIDPAKQSYACFSVVHSTS